MSTTRMLLIIFISMAAIGIDVGFREPIYNFSYSIQTSMKFDIVTVCLAYIVGFLMAWLGWSPSSNDQDSTDAQ